MNAPINDLERLQSKKRKYLLDNFKARVINEDPYIVKINNLLADDEIEEILKMAKDRFERSNIIVDGELIYNNTRTSSTAYIFDEGLKKKYSKPIERMIKRICFLLQCKRNQLEMMCVRYREGEEFTDHVDYFNEDEIGVVDSAGQRIATFFAYLNTLEKENGGATEFTNLGIKSRPVKGDAVFWWNQDPKTGQMLPQTRHQGNPVIGNTVKYGLNLWARSIGFP